MYSDWQNISYLPLNSEALVGADLNQREILEQVSILLGLRMDVVRKNQVSMVNMPSRHTAQPTGDVLTKAEPNNAILEDLQRRLELREP